ncbi:MAG: T9SS type A sorting domain-containing protein [Bacteroidota bacterium]
MKKIYLLLSILLGIYSNIQAQTSTDLYGIVRKNYYSIAYNPFDSSITYQVLDSATIRLGGVNTSNGFVSNLGSNTYQMGINLTGAALNPYDSTYVFVGSNNMINSLHLGNGQLIHQASINNPIASSYFDNFRFCHGDSTMYGLARRNYFDSTLNVTVGELYLAKINTTTGTITQISPNSIGQGYALAGSAIDPYQMVYYYSTGSNLIGVDMYSGNIYSNAAMQLPANSHFDNFTYSCMDTALYGLVRTNYFNSVNPSLLDSATIRLGKINPSTGAVTILSSTSLFGNGYSLNAGSAINPNNMTFYYSTGKFLVGSSLYNGQLNSVDSLQFTDGMYFDLMRNFDNCRTINIIRNNNATGISENNQSSIKLYPNPASKQVFIQSPEEISNIQVLNLQGQTVINQIVDAKEIQLSIESLTNGIYIVKSTTNKGKIVINKLIKD